ncbi:PIPO, partial [Verbena virus Y]|uniref:PIPO n=1 Tax=Verbena virus Y TaxID=515446 RepID=UPI00026515C5
KLSKSLRRGMVRLNVARKIVCNVVCAKTTKKFFKYTKPRAKSRYERNVRYLTKCCFQKSVGSSFGQGCSSKGFYQRDNNN